MTMEVSLTRFLSRQILVYLLVARLYIYRRTLYLHYFSLHITVTLPDYIPEETSIYVISSCGSLNPPCLSLLSDTCDMYLICASTSLHAGHRATEESPPRPLQRRSAPARLTGTCAPHCTQFTVYTLYTLYGTVYSVC